jgi:hypothetical protein
MAGAGLTAASISFFGATTAAGIAAATAASFAVTGAAVGALSAAVTGQDIGRGALIGGITGALTSGFAPGGFGGVEGTALAGGGFETATSTLGATMDIGGRVIEQGVTGGSGIWSNITSSLSNLTLGESFMIGKGVEFVGGVMKGQGQYQAGYATGARQDFLATDKERVAVFNKAASGRDVTESLIATSGVLARNRLLRSSGGFQGSTGTHLDLGNADRRDRIFLANLQQEQGEINERALLTERDLLRQDADAARAQGSFERTSTIITAAGSLLT